MESAAFFEGYSIVQQGKRAVTFKLCQFNSPMNPIAILGKSF